MSSLDRAYVINGEDLRIALGGNGERPPLVPNPFDVARWIVGEIGQLLDDEACRLTPGGQAAPGGDPELAAMTGIAAAMEPLTAPQRTRVLAWADDRYRHGDQF